MNNDVQLGGGNATGMFYTAPENTPLPTYPGDDLSRWTEIGDIDEDGISFAPRSSTTLKNWAGKPKRSVPGADPATVKAKIMDTTESSLKTVFGSENVRVSAATDSHGKLISIDLDSKPSPAAFLFLMKDGDDLKILGTTNGLISELGEVAFKNDEAIEWDVTIQGDWFLICDDGQVES